MMTVILCRACKYGKYPLWTLTKWMTRTTKRNYMYSVMENKVALVTGSTSGIGLGIARVLASKGCAMILNGFGDEELIEQIKSEFITHYNVRTDYINADLSKPAEIQELCKKVKEIHPWGVDILVNNAGFQHVCPIEQFPDSQWDTMLAVMLTAPFQLTKRLLPDMKQKGWGRIVNISSVHGFKASPNKSAYVACKHGIIGLTKVVALETAGTGVTCNAVCPGYVDTPILQGQVQALSEKEDISLEEARVKFLSNFHATGAPVGIDQLAEAVCFICSEAASQMTGSNMVLDGGWSAK